MKERMSAARFHELEKRMFNVVKAECQAIATENVRKSAADQDDGYMVMCAAGMGCAHMLGKLASVLPLNMRERLMTKAFEMVMGEASQHGALGGLAVLRESYTPDEMRAKLMERDVL